MSPETQLVGILGRIASATSALRVRGADAVRLDHNGGSEADLHERLTVLIERLEKVAGELEDALA